jgi:phenylalanyl-tRNA synthetase alpha chain
MSVKELIKSLHPLERRVLPFLDSCKNFNELVLKSNMKDIEVMRALQWLSNRNVLLIKEEENEIIELGINGKNYSKNGLPEKRFLNAIKDSKLSLGEVLKKSGLDSTEVNICIGTLKSKAAVDISKDKELSFSITENGKKLLLKDSLEEIFLKKLFPINLKDLKPEEKFAFDNLLKRKDIILLNKVKTRSFELTALGKQLVSEKISFDDFIDGLTPEIIKSGKWRSKDFRKYDVSINVPKVYGGKRHFESQALDYIRKIWLELGFKEMQGNLVQTSFWDLDSLFVPQDHPARQMQDTFFIKNPSKGKLPDISKKVKEVHENGADTGSKGWGGKWSEDIARENLLRTHTTVLSAQTIAAIKESEMPAKFFSVGKVFRNEALDWKHLFEFYQVEGIVVDPNANLQHLKGYLKEFYKKMGYSDVRMKPAHFPYTEPSVEVVVYNPVRKEWIELGGAGIFRPEVTKTLIGKEIPVLAWGQGMARIIAEYWKMTDIRDIYNNDLKKIREIKYWMK